MAFPWGHVSQVDYQEMTFKYNSEFSLVLLKSIVTSRSYNYYTHIVNTSHKLGQFTFDADGQL